MPPLSLADLINWGWLRIGPPYIYININPIIFQIGGLAVRWYGLMYVVALLVGLQVISGYLARKGISQEVLYRTLWWCIAAGLLGGRLYFVIQQHDFVQGYLQQPWRILATWEGGMAFYGALFLTILMLYWRARIERMNPLVFIDAGLLFASAGQIFGRIGNIINGDIIGYKSTLPWSTVYVNPNSWSCSPYIQLPTCNTPVQPAAGYELLSNIVMFVIMLYLARRLTRPGILTLVYLFSYSITQFLLFFVRDNTIETPFGLNWGLKQAQWTSLVLFIVLLPITYWILRTSKRVPAGEMAATYGIPQPFRKQDRQESSIGNEVAVEEDKETPYPEQDPIISSEVPAISLSPDSELIIGSEVTESDQDTIANQDHTAVTFNPDPTTEPETPEVSLSSESDTTPEPETPEVSLSSEFDTTPEPETPEVALSSESHATPEPEASEVSLSSESDTTPEPETPEVSLSSESDTTPEPETPGVSLSSESHATPDPEASEVALSSEPHTATEPETPEVSLSSESDTTTEPETPEVSLSSESDTTTEPETPEVALSSESHTTPEPETPEVSLSSESDTTTEPETPEVSLSSESHTIAASETPKVSLKLDRG